MKILFIQKFGFGKPGAADAFFLPLTLAKLGHEITIVVKSETVVESLLQHGVQIVHVKSHENWNISLRHIVARKNPDIVHVFMHLGCGIYPFWLTASSKPIFILDIRSPLLRHGFLRQCVRFKNQFEVIGFDVITAHAIESAHTVVGKRHAIQCVPPGVDFDLLTEQVNTHPWQQSRMLKAVYIGSLDKKRRIMNLLEATILASTQTPLLLDIYGTGNDEAEIKQFLEDRKIKTIRLMKLMPRCELFSKLMQYDIGISYIPSELYDMAPPLKTVEFLACGLPVLATDTIGNRLFVQSQINGLLAKEDPVSFAQGIVDITNASWLGAARLNARRSVEQFDWKRIVSEQLLPVYDDALNKKGNL
ncbi:MAG: glycosyltransferase [Legionellaceae bacterium]|nr:glycosyltransferase [Legionellaceae bacterium]